MSKFSYASVKSAVVGNSDESGHTHNKHENVERGNWTNKTDYVFSMIGFAVGLGNVWRFPYLCFKNGGGVFLIPYFTMLMICGLPIFFLESAIGQFCSQGALNSWRAAPLFQGIGGAAIMVTLIVSVYYNTIISYSIFYMFASMQTPVPWAECFEWSNEKCSQKPKVICNTSQEVVETVFAENYTCPDGVMLPYEVQSPSEQYWNFVALKRSSGMSETGPVVWHLALSLLLSSMISGAALIKGIKSSGKVVYFTVSFPYVVILALLIRGVTLDGASEGLEFYLGSKSDFSKLTEPGVWKDAATQIFFSLSIGWGGLTTLSSYNNFHNNVFMDSVIVCFVNAATSMFAGFAIFSILGHMAHLYKVDVSHVVKEGFGLAFIAYPDALSNLPGSPVWSALFFFMLLTLGLDSQFALLEVITTAIQDAFPKFFKKQRRSYLTIATTLINYLIGLITVTKAGVYWVVLMDQFVANWMMLLIVFLELVTIFYVYGGRRMVRDIEMMIGKKTYLFWMWWKICWFFLTPVVILVILIWSLTSFEPPTYGDVKYPTWGLALGWSMMGLVLVWLPLVAIYKISQANGTLWERVKWQSRPAVNWHPYLEIHRGRRYTKRRCYNRKNPPQISRV